MILALKATDKLTELITFATAKNEERKKGAIANTKLYEDSKKSPDHGYPPGSFLVRRILAIQL
jgi:hypothetical protein